MTMKATGNMVTAYAGYVAAASALNDSAARRQRPAAAAAAAASKRRASTSPATRRDGAAAAAMADVAASAQAADAEAQLYRHDKSTVSGDAPNGTKRVRTGDAPQMVGKKMELIQMRPLNYCSIIRHPCRQDVAPETFAPLVAIWEFQFPASFWPSNPEGFVNLTGENPSSTLKILRILYLAGYLANRVISTKKVMSPPDPETGKSHLVEEASTSTITITWERVPHRDNPKCFVAYRLRLVEHGDATSRHGLLRQLTSLITMNMANDEKAMMASGGAPPKFPKDPSSFTFITQAAWNELCMWHRPDIGKELAHCPVDQLNNICSRESPFRPNFAFSPVENLETARRMGAHEDYCSKENLYKTDKWGLWGHTFGEGGINAWQIAPHSLDPRTLSITWFPFRGPDSRLFTREMLEYGKMHNITEPDELRRIFNMTCNTSSQQQEAHDMNNLTKRIKTEMGELRSVYRAEVQGPKACADDEDDVKPEFYFAQLKMRLDHLTLFNEIISPTGDCPPSMQAIAQEKEQYLMRNNQQMCVPMESGYGNLSRFQNQRAIEAVSFDSIMTVSTCHADALLYLYSALHVYARVLMNWYVSSSSSSSSSSAQAQAPAQLRSAQARAVHES